MNTNSAKILAYSNKEQTKKASVAAPTTTHESRPRLALGQVVCDFHRPFGQNHHQSNCPDFRTPLVFHCSN